MHVIGDWNRPEDASNPHGMNNPKNAVFWPTSSPFPRADWILSGKFEAPLPNNHLKGAPNPVPHKYQRNPIDLYAALKPRPGAGSGAGPGPSVDDKKDDHCSTIAIVVIALVAVGGATTAVVLLLVFRRNGEGGSSASEDSEEGGGY